MKIGELFLSLGFKVEGKDKLDDAEKGMERAGLKAAGLAVAVNAVNYAFLAMLNGAMKAAVGFKNFAIATGLSADELKVWQQAAEVDDVSAQELTSSIEALQAAQAEIRLGRGNIAPWQLLGISPNQNPFEVLRQLRDRARELPPELARSIMGQMGVSDGVFRMLRNANLELDKLQTRYRLTERQEADLIRLNRAWKDLVFSLVSVRDKFAAEFAPAAEKAVRALKALVDGLAKFVEWLRSSAPIATAVRWLLVGIAAAFGVIGVALAAVAALFAIATAAMIAFELAASPILPILLAISGIIALVVVGLAALAAAVDDVWTYFRGGKSVLGDVIDQFRLIFSTIHGWIVELNAATPDWLKKMLSRGASIAVSAGGGGFNPSAFLPNTSGARGNSVVQHNNVEVNVDGAGDPRAVGREVGRSVKDEISDAAYQMPIQNY